MKAEERAVISGIGRSRIGRRLDIDPRILTVHAARAAIADAGLEAADIDGVSTYPGAIWSTPGITGAGVEDVRELLGLRLKWYAGGGEMAGQLGSLVNAVLAVASGVCTNVLCFRTLWESTAQSRIGARAAVVASSPRPAAQWGKPYGAGYSTYGALNLRRYMHESGATREQLAQLAVVSRSHAAGNPDAVYREPMKVDDYLDARMISDPLCIYDCDVPVDGSVAVIVSRADRTTTGTRPPVRIEAMSSAPGWDACAEMLWSRTSLRPADIDVAEIYDGFNIIAIRWLEALGLTPRLGTGRFLEGGHRIALDGELPLNTGGGQLSGGRLHGYGALLEACIQLRDQGGARQVPSQPEVAIVTSGVDTFSSAFVLRR